MIETRRGLERDAARVAALMTSCAPGDSTLVVVCPTDAACLDLTAVLRDIGCSARSLLRSSKDSDRRILERELGERSVSTIVTVSDALRRLPAGINAKVLAWEDIEGAGAQPDDVSRAAVALRARMASGVAIPRHVAWPEHVATASSRIPVTQLAAPGIAACRTDGLMLVPECQAVARHHDQSPYDGPLPFAFREPVTSVVNGWTALRRGRSHVPEVGGIAVLSSPSRPILIEHFAWGLSQILRSQVVGTLPVVANGSASKKSMDRFQRATQSIRLPMTPHLARACDKKRIVLVTDVVRSGWSVAAAARLLRGLGAKEVLPVALLWDPRREEHVM